MDKLFSIRMRASDTSSGASRHISGAERICPAEQLSALADQMIQRALHHPLGDPTHINIAIDLLAEPVSYRQALPVFTSRVETIEEGRAIADLALRTVGIDAQVLARVTPWIWTGPNAHGGNMRGAMIVDVASGERLETDQAAGVRTTRIDITDQARHTLAEELRCHQCYGEKTFEALTLTTKVCAHPDVVAEFCCSDDPDYQGGYVASANLGYVRIDKLKELGCPIGGRIVFVRTKAIENVVSYLKKRPVIVDRIGRVDPVCNAAQTVAWLRARVA